MVQLDPGTARGYTDPAAVDPKFIIDRLLRLETLPGFEARYQLKYELLALQPGESVLDVGCGIGRDLLRMAPLVGGSGSVVGFDISAALVEHARQRMAEAGFANGRVLHGDSGPLPFPDATFDAVHTNLVLQFADDLEGTLAEMVRVTRPGGRIVCCEMDYGGRFLDFEDMSLVEKVYARGGYPRNPYIGRQLFRRFRRLGLTDVEVQGYLRTGTDAAAWGELGADLQRAISEGAVTGEEAERFESQFRARVAAGEFLSASASFVARGTKPAAAPR